MKRPGSTIAIGDELGHAMEPSVRWARLVAVRHIPEREIHRYVVRVYNLDDKPGIPTGEYRTTSAYGLQPYQPDT